jgi:imidazole glycerol phosphate synthase subunit HisF
MIHTSIQQLINNTVTVLDRDPLSQSEDTHAILLKFTQALATELGEILVNSTNNQGVQMYFDEKIARYEVKKAVGL